MLGFVLSVVGAGLAGAVFHELTHYAVARLAGREAAINWLALDVFYAVPDSGPNRVDYAITVAPIVIGLLIAPAILLSGVDVSVPLVVGWAVYTLNGGLEDLRVTLVDTDAPP